MALDGAAPTTALVAAPTAAGAADARQGSAPRGWLQEEVLAELQGPLALNSKPEARCGQEGAFHECTSVGCMLGGRIIPCAPLLLGGPQRPKTCCFLVYGQNSGNQLLSL